MGIVKLNKSQNPLDYLLKYRFQRGYKEYIYTATYPISEGYVDIVIDCCKLNIRIYSFKKHFCSKNNCEISTVDKKININEKILFKEQEFIDWLDEKIDNILEVLK